MRPTSPPPRTAPRISEPQLGKILDGVFVSPFIKGYVSGLAHLGIDVSKVKAAAIKKLAPLVMTKAPKPGAAARVRKLQKELAAQPNPVLQTEIRRRLAFAELEARGGAR